MIDHDTLLNKLENVAYQAGEIILHYYNKKSYAQQQKKDGSIVTQADCEADDFISHALSELTPSIPVISEEGKKHFYHEEPIIKKDHNITFWCVDPIDGTSQFIDGLSEFAVSIGLILDGVPTIGVIYQPIEEYLVIGSSHQLIVKKGLKKDPQMDDGSFIDVNHVVFVGNKKEEKTKEYKNFLENYFLKDHFPTVIKSSLKFSYLAEKKGRYIFRSRPSYEWDTAAGHAILKGLGGNILTFDGEELRYGKKDFYNSGFIAYAW